MTTGSKIDILFKQQRSKNSLPIDQHSTLIRDIRTGFREPAIQTGAITTLNSRQLLALELAAYSLPTLRADLSELDALISMVVANEGFSAELYTRATTSRANAMAAIAELEQLESIASQWDGVGEQFKLPNVAGYLASVKTAFLDPDGKREIIAGGEQLIKEGEQLLQQLRDTARDATHFAKSEVAADLNLHKRLTAVYFCSGLFVILLVCYLLVGFYRGVSEAIEQLKASAEELANGDLKVRIEPTTHDEMREIAVSFNRISTAFESSVGEVKHSMQEIERSVSDVSVVARETLSGMAQHHEEIDAMVAAMTEMSATAQEVEKNTVEAAEATRQAENHTQEGESVVESAINTIQRLAQEVVRTSDVMQQLAEDANGIGAVTDVIRGIADQTNLLALNAAIEAARAGEQGRGFAVVADEVRTLAQRTRESTDEIQNMINALQGASSDALEVIHASRENVNESVEKIEKTGQALSAISDSVNSVNSMNEQIASAATEQASTADELTSNMARVRNIAEQASDGANSVAAASEQLTALSHATVVGLSHYKVD